MNCFLRSWANGRHPRLRKLDLEMAEYELLWLMDGLDATLVERETYRPFVVSEGETELIGDSWDIRGDRIASIYNFDETGPSSSFSMVVWPDFEGNMYEL
uniref:FBA_2 domain-containing protein n=1 Tax=Caenorhabditis tropicalis TaxID=1561998 RepID=A0A1I7U430_9PELO